MTERKVRFKETSNVVPCSKCGNKTDFSIISSQVAEDCCEVWARCRCGHEHDSDERLEDVWGGVGDDNVVGAIGCWNDAELAAQEATDAR